MEKLVNMTLLVGLTVLLTVVGSDADMERDPLHSLDKPRDATPQQISTSEIEQIDPGELTCDAVVTFDDIPGGAAPGTNYDAIFESSGAKLAERFVGQTLAYNGNFDVLSGAPTSPLTLQAGSPNQNLCVYVYGGTGSQIMPGLGPVGFPDYNAIGEGSFAVLFDYDQSEFGFDLVGGEGGNAYLSFFKRDGSLIEAIVLGGLANTSYAFRRVGGIHDIAGISIHNDDAAGIGVDNLCHDIGGVPGDPPVCDANGPYIGCVGQDILFDGTGSYDPDGDIVSYEWDFGDGNSGSGPTPTHAYGSPGLFTVVLCVTDNDTLSTCCETTVDSSGASETETKSWGSMKRYTRD